MTNEIDKINQLNTQISYLQKELANVKNKTCDALLTLTDEKQKALIGQQTANEILTQVALSLKLENPDIATVMTKLQKLMELPSIVKKLKNQIPQDTPIQGEEKEEACIPTGV